MPSPWRNVYLTRLSAEFVGSSRGGSDPYFVPGPSRNTSDKACMAGLRSGLLSNWTFKWSVPLSIKGAAVWFFLMMTQRVIAEEIYVVSKWEFACMKSLYKAASFQTETSDDLCHSLSKAPWRDFYGLCQLSWKKLRYVELRACMYGECVKNCFISNRIFKLLMPHSVKGTMEQILRWCQMKFRLPRIEHLHG